MENNQPCPDFIGNKIKTSIILRDLVNFEIQKSEEKVVKINPESLSLEIKNDQEVIQYENIFDNIYCPKYSLQQIFETNVSHYIDKFLEGYNCTFLGIGTKSSGKTYTITGNMNDQNLQGILPKSMDYLFKKINNNTNSNLEYKVSINICSIHYENITDLLNKGLSPSTIQIRECKNHGIYIRGLKYQQLNNFQEFLQLLKEAWQNVLIESTYMGQMISQRSIIYDIQLQIIDKKNIENFKFCNLKFVDLQNDRRPTKFQATGLNLKESTIVNRSFIALCQIVSALTDNKSKHIPYRDSKITRILQNSLGGYSYTQIFFPLSPSIITLQETLSILKLAKRFGQIQNQPQIKTYDQQKFEEFQNELQMYYSQKCQEQILKQQEKLEKLQISQQLQLEQNMLKLQQNQQQNMQQQQQQVQQNQQNQQNT